ncbi:MAG: hypothetical protein HOP10_01445 [Chitinophagaceae bacterium]|nr:hypothetical protein [Chitinophagaceae bacterium]
MKKNVFLSITVLLLACTAMRYYLKKKNKPSGMYECRITVTGNAKNISGRAAVVAPSTAVYYVDGLAEWQPDWIGQEVKVTGDLLSCDKNNYNSGNDLKMDDRTGKVISAAVVMLLSNAPEYNY